MYWSSAPRAPLLNLPNVIAQSDKGESASLVSIVHSTQTQCCPRFPQRVKSTFSHSTKEYKNANQKNQQY